MTKDLIGRLESENKQEFLQAYQNLQEITAKLKGTMPCYRYTLLLKKHLQKYQDLTGQSNPS